MSKAIELGSSDAAPILGVSPHETPWQCAARLTGLIPDDREETEAMEFGTRLQGEILRAFCAREGWIIEKEQPTYRVGNRRATPDGLLISYDKGQDRTRLALAEVKCVVGHVPDVPRIDWLVQCLHQRWVAGTAEEIETQYLIAFGGLRLVWWEIPYHDRAIRRVLDEEERFLDHLAHGIMPPVRAADAAALNRRWPWVEPKAVELPDVLRNCLTVIEEADAQIAKWKDLADTAEAEIKTALAEATEGRFSDGSRVTWKPYQRKGYEVKPSVVRPFKHYAAKEASE